MSIDDLILTADADDDGAVEVEPKYPNTITAEHRAGESDDTGVAAPPFSAAVAVAQRAIADGYEPPFYVQMKPTTFAAAEGKPLEGGFSAEVREDGDESRPHVFRVE